MAQADTMLRTDGGEIWYSGDYLKRQIELAYRAGIAQGIKVDIHLMQPLSEGAVNDYTMLFWSKVDEHYRKALWNGHVMKVASKELKPNG